MVRFNSIRPRGSKYGAVSTTVDGVRFDSKREANRYQELRLLVKAGRISELVLQPSFPFVINGEPVKMGNGHTAKYTADFAYTEVATGKRVIEEVKGYKVRDYPLRKAIAEHIYGIEVVEV